MGSSCLFPLSRRSKPKGGKSRVTAQLMTFFPRLAFPSPSFSRGGHPNLEEWTERRETSRKRPKRAEHKELRFTAAWKRRASLPLSPKRSGAAGRQHLHFTIQHLLLLLLPLMIWPFMPRRLEAVAPQGGPSWKRRVYPPRGPSSLLPSFQRFHIHH